ncbi:MAG: aminoacyl-tRNA hydrolase [Planctomycetaceae bacterium]|nr:aminoacyl-tRNA hydrolase [Planctomycetaceae bacterium]MCP4479153.1 aminoacyl-tRNA hydrolase [Planctomycetaceae bacterium]MCP4779062.1 aminoacyl-tRNA hydrolase [Planctomycetaceae bacterium]
MKIVVGLGNPGREYDGTRHNVGFEVLAMIAQRFDVGRPKAKFKAEVAEVSIKNQKTILLSPLTFMNLSGQSVRAALDFYKLPLNDVLVVCDDINLDVARLRFRPSGSAGGQNGLKNIIQQLGSQDFGRLRVGVGKTPANWNASDFVLGKFGADERSEIDLGISRAANAVEAWIEHGIEVAMNRFNANPAQQKKKKSETNKRVVDPPNQIRE